MMKADREPPEHLLEARRLLDGLARVQIVEDLTWLQEVERWRIRLSLTTTTGDRSVVPARSEWWFLLEDRYPFGKIEVRPDAERGLSETFPHQDYNGQVVDGLGWRTGKICVRTPFDWSDRSILGADPVGQKQRLRWYVGRSLTWLDSAAEGKLLRGGDPFELPDFRDVERQQLTIAYSESVDVYRVWQESKDRWGVAELVQVGGERSPWIVKLMATPSGRPIHVPEWGQAVRSATSTRRAVWIRFKELPVKPPYARLNTWGELRTRLESAEVGRAFRGLLEEIRDEPEPLLLLGFAVPRHVGDAPEQMHWQPIALPPLARNGQFRDGFRDNAEGRYRFDLQQGFARGAPLSWHRAENWAVETLSARGQMTKLCNLKALVIGVGAVGSLVAEGLARGGCRRIAVCDSDSVEHANLSRHTATLEDVGNNKAIAVADRLNRITAWVDAVAIPEAFPPQSDDFREPCRDADLIIDCTADDTVINALESFDRKAEARLISLSIGLEARLLYLFAAIPPFPASVFWQSVNPWIERNRAASGTEVSRISSLGCWHPTYPARGDAIGLLVNSALHQIARLFASEGQSAHGLAVFERSENGRVAEVVRSVDEANTEADL